MDNATTTTPDPAIAAALANRLASLRRFVRRQNRWFRHVDAVMEGGVTMNRRLRPSNRAKDWAYDDADAVARLLDIPRPTTFAELCAMVGEPNDSGR